VQIETASTTATTVTIPDRFNGPPGSANGGYTCGLVASMIEGPAQVVLRRPPPLATPLVLETGEGSVTLSQGGTPIAFGTSAAADFQLPSPPTLDMAWEAGAGCAGIAHHPFPTCFVCGPERAAGDGLRIFPGPVRGTEMLASSWVPRADLADIHGVVRNEFVWAALDCPTGWAALDLRPPGTVVVLGTLAVNRAQQVEADQVYVVAAWPVRVEGRKLYADAALWSGDGRLCAAAHATWIEVARP
jgi:acyl-coenzyme A thioesterase PaaI-like protein